MTSDVGTVLIVDARDAAAATADRLDAALDVECVTAADVPAALEVLDRRRVDCVVSEYEVPDAEGVLFQGGERLLERVRERDGDLPFVLYTNVSNEDVARRAVAEGVTAYVRKYDRAAAEDLLAERVATALEHRRTGQRAERNRHLTAVVRDVNGALVRADDRESIARTVPAELAGDLYDGAAFVATDRDVTAGGPAGDGSAPDVPAATVSAVEGAGLSVARGDAVDPSLVAGEAVSVHDAADGSVVDPVDGDRRVAVVPVDAGERRFGAVVLATDRPGAFDETELSVLAELGDTVAYAIEAVETRAELERQNERLETFTSVVSHDLRNPLQVANVFLEAARGERDSDDLERVAEAHDRMLELVDDVLTLAREGQAVVDPTPFDLETVARDAWATVDDRAATLVVESTGTVRGDPSRVQQILENLFRNAVEHGSTSHADASASADAVEHGSTSQPSHAPEDAVEHGVADPPATDRAVGEAVSRGPTANGGTARRGDGVDAVVTVRVGTFDGGFYVADDGPGIPTAEREDVFEMGYTSSESGTGYGLAIVAELADAHGWDVRATESSDGGARIELLTG